MRVFLVQKIIYMPKISILLPTYNGALYIEEAIESVLKQTYQDWELIILDDQSTDSTGEISKKYEKLDPRIKYVRNEKNLRLPANLNKGISLAHGSLIARIDEDDVWVDTDKLKKQMEFFDNGNDYVLVGASFEVVDEEGKNIRNVFPPTEDAAIRKIFLTYNPFCHSSVIFKKGTVEKVGGYDSSIKYGEDYDLWLKMGRLGRMAILPSISVRYLQRKGNMSSKHTVMDQIKFHVVMLAKHGGHYPNLMRALSRLIFYTIKKII